MLRDKGCQLVWYRQKEYMQRLVFVSALVGSLFYCAVYVEETVFIPAPQIVSTNVQPVTAQDSVSVYETITADTSEQVPHEAAKPLPLLDNALSVQKTQLMSASITTLSAPLSEALV